MTDTAPVLTIHDNRRQRRMRHFQRLMYERAMKRIPEMENEAAALRKQAKALPKRFWARKRLLRQEANEIAAMTREFSRQMQMLKYRH